MNFARPLSAPRPAGPAHILESDAEALAVAGQLSSLLAARAVDRDKSVSAAELDAFSQSGLGSMNVPNADGGPGLSYATIARVLTLIASEDAVVAGIARSHLGLVDRLRVEPDGDLKSGFLRAALDGTRFGATPSERGAIGSLDTSIRIVRDGDRFILSGATPCAADVLFAHVLSVPALDADGTRLHAFIDRDTPGLAIEQHVARRSLGTVHLERVTIGAARVVPAHAAIDAARLHATIVQFLAAAVNAGKARGAIDQTIASIHEQARLWRESAQAETANDPFAISEVADLKVRLHTAEAVLARAGRAIDKAFATENDDTEAAITEAAIAVAEAIVLATDIAVHAANKRVELGGSPPDPDTSDREADWRLTGFDAPRHPVRWTFHAIGNYVVNGTKPPDRPGNRA